MNTRCILQDIRGRKGILERRWPNLINWWWQPRVLCGENDFEVASGVSGLWLINHVCQDTGKTPAKLALRVWHLCYRKGSLSCWKQSRIVKWPVYLLSLFCLPTPQTPIFLLGTGGLCVALHRPSEVLCLFLWASLCTYFYQHYFSCLTPALRGNQNELKQLTNHPRMTGLDSWFCFPPQEHRWLHLAWGWGVCECLWYRAG